MIVNLSFQKIGKSKFKAQIEGKKEIIDDGSIIKPLATILTLKYSDLITRNDTNIFYKGCSIIHVSDITLGINPTLDEYVCAFQKAVAQANEQIQEIESAWAKTQTLDVEI